MYHVKMIEIKWEVSGPKAMRWQVNAFDPIAVEIDGDPYMVYGQVRAMAENDRVSIELTWNGNGKYVLTGVYYIGSLAFPVSALDLRLAINQQVQAITESAIYPMISTEKDGLHVYHDGNDFVGKKISRDVAAKVARPLRRRQITDEFLLEQVAPIVDECESQGLAYAPVIADRLHVSPESARNYRAKLRKLRGEK